MSGSPYINHFTQPDSIIPNPANPQSLNRFSYVQNNPVRYIDPTGHWLVENPDGDPCTYVACLPSEPDPPSGGGGSPDNEDVDDILSGVSGDGGEGNCVPEPGQWICDLDALNYEFEYCPITYSLVECYKHRLPLYMGNEPMDINPAEWEDLLNEIRNDVHGKSEWELIAMAVGFDTPFYDESVYGLGRLTGVGCIYQQCYDRSELNYVAQGELWAAAGYSIETTMTIVQVWKFSPVMHFPTVASGGTLVMTNIGYYDYKNNYP